MIFIDNICYSFLGYSSSHKGSFAEKKFYKIKFDKILFKIEFVTIFFLRRLAILSIENGMLAKLNYKNLINNFIFKKIIINEF